MNIKLRNFTTPSFVTMETLPTLRQDGYREAPSFSISDVDADTLSELCATFRTEVFKKAGKRDPLKGDDA